MNEDLGRAVLDSLTAVHIGVAVLSDGRLIFANTYLSALSGYTPDELTRLSLADVMSPNEIARLLEQRAQHVASREVPRYQVSARLKGGRIVPFEVTLAETTWDGKVMIAAFVSDISDRQRMERAQQALSTGAASFTGDRFFREIARSLAELLEADVGFVTTVISPNSPRVYTVALSVDGQPAAPIEYTLPGSPCEEVMASDCLVVTEGVRQRFPDARLVEALGASGYAGFVLNDHHKRPIGTLGVLSRGPLRHAAHAEALLQLFAIRTSAELECRRTEARFHDLFEFSPDAILMVDEEGRITVANRQAVAMFGYARTELVTMMVEELMPEPSRGDHVELRRRFLAAARPRTMGASGSRLFARRKDGVVFPVDIGLSPMQSDTGRVVVVAVRDITERVRVEDERRALEAQLREAQKLEAVGRLAGGIAHDFNNLLAVIVANVENARMDGNASDLVTDSLGEIAIATTRAAQLVDQILTIGRKHPPDRIVMSLQSVVDEIVKQLRATSPARVELVVHSAVETPDILADPTQLHQVLMNLGTNALHAISTRPGRVEITLEPIEVSPGEPRLHAELEPGRYARLSIRDNGGGIAPGNLQRVFEPFFTTRPRGQGSGLGLAVAHGIVKEHGGVITVDSRVDHGTTFRVYLPAVDSTEQGNPAPLPPRPVSPKRSRIGRGQRILLLDDEQALVRGQLAVLARLGFVMTGFTDPHEALAAVRSDPTGFDVVVTDLDMPELSGAEVAIELGRLAPELPVILMSGLFPDRTMPSNVRYQLSKPFKGKDLAFVLHRLTSKPEAE